MRLFKRKPVEVPHVPDTVHERNEMAKRTMDMIRSWSDRGQAIDQISKILDKHWTDYISEAQTIEEINDVIKGVIGREIMENHEREKYQR